MRNICLGVIVSASVPWAIACHLPIHHAVKLQKRKSQQIIEREN
ncbi:hypothetical protein WKK05_34655 [Nostoc sp. UHCC 0302]